MILHFQKYGQVGSRFLSPKKDALLGNGKISRIRQAAEWGNGNLESIWTCVQLPLTVDARKRRRLLKVAIWLLNLKTRLCGFTQIHTVYSGNSMEEEPWFLDMDPGIGLQTEEVSQS
jgi:hypothetical protein